ncbi:hypothetical protein M569_06343, partial [Genlisea aurea]
RPMAPSTPPPPPPPPPPPEASNSSISASSAAGGAPLQNPTRPPNPLPFYSQSPSRLPSNPNPNYPQLAPRTPHSQDPSQIGSSGGGIVSRPLSAGRPTQRPPYGSPCLLDQGLARPNNLNHVILGPMRGSSADTSGAGAMPGVAQGIPFPTSSHSKVHPHSILVGDSNGHTTDLRGRHRDDVVALIRDRKVRLSENASLYALCRSWLRNGVPADMQPQYVDVVKSLPRPSHVSGQTADSPEKNEASSEVETEDEDSVGQLSEKELLQRHIKRAKKIRSKLNERRFKRIDRYKSRLALLLSST